MSISSYVVYETGNIYIAQMFKNSFWSSRSSSWDKDLLLLVNPYKTQKNVHTKHKKCNSD